MNKRLEISSQIHALAYQNMPKEIADDLTNLLLDYSDAVKENCNIDFIKWIKTQPTKKIDAYDDKMIVDEYLKSACHHPPQERVRTHRGYHCGICGKRF